MAERWIVLRERVQDPDREILLGPGTSISVADAKRLGVGDDGRQKAQPDDAPAPAHAEKRPRARTRQRILEEHR